MTARAGLLTALVVAALAQSGDARVIMRPTIPSTCNSGPSWARVTACLERFGKVKLLSGSADVKLVALSGDGIERGYRTAGIYLYKLHDKRWSLGGMQQGDGYSLVALTTFKSGRFTGHRFDLRSTSKRQVLLHDRQRSAYLRQTVAMFCSGQSHVCSEVVVTCDVYVEGKSYWMFRGKPEIVGDRLLVRGDRSTAGAECAQNEESWLPAFAE